MQTKKLKNKPETVARVGLQRAVRPLTSISYRAHDWYDTKKRTGRYGIQAKAVGYECRWLHCAESGEPLLFDTEAERDSKLKELRRRSNSGADSKHPQ
jgi:hypothetical protein